MPVLSSQHVLYNPVMSYRTLVRTPSGPWNVLLASIEQLTVVMTRDLQESWYSLHPPGSGNTRGLEGAGGQADHDARDSCGQVYIGQDEAEKPDTCFRD